MKARNVLGGSDDTRTRPRSVAADDMAVRACLAHEIVRILEHRHLTQQLAADLLRLPQPSISGLLHGRLHGISQARLLACLNRLGRDVDIVIRRTDPPAPGRTTVHADRSGGAPGILRDR